MITAAEAYRIAATSVAEIRKTRLENILTEIITHVAQKGGRSTTLDMPELTDAEKTYIRKVLTEQQFQLSDVGLTIYW